MLVLLGVLSGMALPIGGCQDCPQYEVEGSYLILDFDNAGQPAHTRDWIEGSGRVEVDETTFVISYTTPDDSRWEVEYVRTETYGPP
ncbi:hypothetical protein ACNOYE_18720 [Nannocystaceae bacterium ST9]